MVTLPPIPQQPIAENVYWRQWFFFLWTYVIKLFNTTSTTVGAAGTATALPAKPVGYITVKVNGEDYKIPYYNV